MNKSYLMSAIEMPHLMNLFSYSNPKMSFFNQYLSNTHTHSHIISAWQLVLVRNFTAEIQNQ